MPSEVKHGERGRKEKGTIFSFQKYKVLVFLFVFSLIKPPLALGPFR